MKFKIGERVAVYHGVHKGKAYVEGFRGELLILTGGIFPDEMRGLKIVSPKQCRRLKPKQKPREFWIQLGKNMTLTTAINTYIIPAVTQFEPSDPENWIHVKEVRAKK